MQEFESNIKNSKEKSFLAKLVKGDFGFFKMYWFYGVMVFCFICLIVIFFTYSISNSAYRLFIVSIFWIFYVMYSLPMFIGIWRASNDYQGFNIWRILAKLSILIALPFVLFLFLGCLGILLQMFDLM
jgi:hypothetical protein